MKKILCLLLCVVMLLSMAACAGESYEDTNGDEDTSLQTITDEQIIHLSVGSSGMSYEETNLGDVLSSSEYHSRNFNGVERLYTTNFLLPSDITVYIGHYQINSGNFKLVVVCDGAIIHEFDRDTFGETFVFEDLKGDFSIIAAGESANFTFYMDVY